MPVALQNGLGVFVGTLPLCAVIFWAAFQQSQRLFRLESQYDGLGAKIDKLISQSAEQNTRIA